MHYVCIELSSFAAYNENLPFEIELILLQRNSDYYYYY